MNMIVNFRNIKSKYFFKNLISKISRFVIDMWDGREVFFFLVLRERKIRYKQTFMGILWAVLKPLLTLGVLSLFLGQLMVAQSQNVPYILFLTVGFLPWVYFSQGIADATNSVVNYADIIKKVYFPRIFIPFSVVAVVLIDFLVGIAILTFFLFYFGFLSLKFLFFVPFYILTVSLICAAVALIFSALNVRFRDVGLAVPHILQFGMFITPVVYSSSLFPSNFNWVFRFNPLAVFIESSRNFLFDTGTVDYWWLSCSVLFSFLLFVVGVCIFNCLESQFADQI